MTQFDLKSLHWNHKFLGTSFLHTGIFPQPHHPYMPSTKHRSKSFACTAAGSTWINVEFAVWCIRSSRESRRGMYGCAYSGHHNALHLLFDCSRSDFYHACSLSFSFHLHPLVISIYSNVVIPRILTSTLVGSVNPLNYSECADKDLAYTCS